MHFWGRQNGSAANDGGGRDSGTRAEALAALGATIQRHASDGSGLEHLRTPIRLVCARAKRDGVLAERLVIELKHTFVSAPELVALSPLQRDEVRDRVIHFAIKAYYDDGQ